MELHRVRVIHHLLSALLLVFLVASQVFARQDAQDKSLAKWRELNERVVKLQGAGLYVKALPIANRALELAERTVGPDDPVLATSLESLATNYRGLNRYETARSLYERAIEIREKRQGPNHPDLATTRADLALVYELEQKYAEAEPLYESALAVKEMVLGLNSAEVVGMAERLCSVYRATGRSRDADDLEKRVGQGRILTPEYAGTRPTLVHHVDPLYPGRALRQGLEGSVKLNAVILRDGSVRFANVTRSSDTIFNAAAIDAVRRWTYKPATLGGEPFPAYFEIEVNFSVPRFSSTESTGSGAFDLFYAWTGLDWMDQHFPVLSPGPDMVFGTYDDQKYPVPVPK